MCTCQNERIDPTFLRLRRFATSTHKSLQPLQSLRVDRVRRHGVALHGLLSVEILLAERAADRRVGGRALALVGCGGGSESVSYGMDCSENICARRRRIIKFLKLGIPVTKFRPFYSMYCV